jgi:hypothetical protein
MKRSPIKGHSTSPRAEPKTVSEWQEWAETLQTDMEGQAGRIADLEAAIRNHRDQRGDDRCFLDDLTLYEAVGLQQANTALPPKDVFLGNCARYWECRQSPGDKYLTVAEQLTTQLARDRAPTLTVLRRALEYCQGPNDYEQKDVCDMLKDFIKEFET